MLKEGQTLKDLFGERTPLYERYAHLTVDVDGADIQGVVERIVTAMSKEGA